MDKTPNLTQEQEVRQLMETNLSVWAGVIHAETNITVPPPGRQQIGALYLPNKRQYLCKSDINSRVCIHGASGPVGAPHATHLLSVNNFSTPRRRRSNYRLGTACGRRIDSATDSIG